MRMNFIFLLVASLVLLLISPIVWAGQIQSQVDKPKFVPLIFQSHVPVIQSDCRDVSVTIQQAVIIYKSNQSKSRSIILENALATSGKDETTFNFKGAAHRAGIGKVLLPMTAKQNTKSYKPALVG